MFMSVLSFLALFLVVYYWVSIVCMLYNYAKREYFKTRTVMFKIGVTVMIVIAGPPVFLYYISFGRKK